MIFLVSSKKDDISFPRKYDLIFRRKMKDENTWKYDVFCMFAKDAISFSYKYEITLLSKKQRWSFLEKYT